MSWTGPTTDAEALFFLSPSLQQRWSWSWGCKNHLTLSPFRGPPPPLSLSSLSLWLRPTSLPPSIQLLYPPPDCTQNRHTEPIFKGFGCCMTPIFFWILDYLKVKTKKKSIFSVPLQREDGPTSSSSAASIRFLRILSIPARTSRGEHHRPGGERESSSFQACCHRTNRISLSGVLLNEVRAAWNVSKNPLMVKKRKKEKTKAAPFTLHASAERYCSFSALTRRPTSL